MLEPCSKCRFFKRPVSNVFFGSFSTKIPELQDEGCSDHLLAGEHRPGSGVSGAGAEPGVDERVLDVLVAQPVLGEVDVSTGI